MGTYVCLWKIFINIKLRNSNDQKFRIVLLNKYKLDNFFYVKKIIKFKDDNIISILLKLYYMQHNARGNRVTSIFLRLLISKLNNNNKDFVEEDM